MSHYLHLFFFWFNFKEILFINDHNSNNSNDEVIIVVAAVHLVLTRYLVLYYFLLQTNLRLRDGTHLGWVTQLVLQYVVSCTEEIPDQPQAKRDTAEPCCAVCSGALVA